jgi:hypothetical protein
MLIAALPFIFAIQQIIDGFVWLSLTHIEWCMLHEPTTYIFLIIAQVNIAHICATLHAVAAKR